ncbi:zinc finger Ran-binding domain-containing protein [Bernardetia sp. ABR2-2B]|uniref:zinc finger Ran-binding domain-containing protein n=1 Tax=Bernardetia sp. ABR2-2B TaxID=3127472 RepID=UPI0030CE5F68
MSLAVILHAIGTIPLFASRAFLPAFLTSLLFRFPNFFSFAEVDAPAADLFITKTPVIIVLGILAVLEILADKNTDIKALWLQAEPFLKPIIYSIMLLGVVDNDSQAIMQGIYQAGMGDYVMIFFTAGAVYGLTILRTRIQEWLLEIDGDGDLFLNFIFSSIEDTFVFFGFFLLLATGIGAVIFFGIVVGVLYLWQRKIQSNEEKQKITCSSCQHKNPPFALECSNCHTPQKEIYKIGFLGQKKEEQINDDAKARKKQMLSLLTQERCGYCAIKTNKKVCPTCKKEHILNSSENRKAYIMFVQKRYALWFPLSIALGFVPILGIAIAILGANLYVFAPLKRQIPTIKAVGVQILTKLLIFLVIFFGSIAGFILAPLYCSIRFFMWRAAFVKHWK